MSDIFDQDSIDNGMLDAAPLPEQATAEKQHTVNDIPPEVISAIKAQVIAEMQSDDKRKEEEAKIRQAEQKKQHDEYVATMKASPDPWVEIEGWAETPQGVKVELEWNEAFVEELKKQGITGADEDQVVQKWITLLMHDMSSKMENEQTTEFE